MLIAHVRFCIEVWGVTPISTRERESGLSGSLFFSAISMDAHKQQEKKHLSAERINRLLPKNNFEFIITSSNYIFRKPHKRLFDLVLEKAGLRPEEVWYIGAIDLPYYEDKSILTITEIGRAHV